jgi:cob(I)alamin adenosyltransferase
MGKRLTRIYTRTGDDGTTGLADGSRTSKDSARIAAIGDVDELNSAMGVLLAETLPQAVATALSAVQHDLFDLGGELSVPGHALIVDAHVTRLERALDALNGELPALEDFILPGGTRAAATAHVARAVCRRAERSVVTLARRETIAPALLHYLNRLSDLLFVAARAINEHAGIGDVLWEQGKSRRPE